MNKVVETKQKSSKWSKQTTSITRECKK